MTNKRDDELQLNELGRTPLSQMVKWGGGAAVPVGLISLAAHGGVASLLVAAGAAFVAARHGQQSLNYLHDHVELPEIIDRKLTEQRQRGSKRTIAQRLLGQFPESIQEKATTALPAADKLLEVENAEVSPQQEDTSEETIFASPSALKEVSGVSRVTVDQCVAHTEYNGFAVFLGRSLTRPNNPAVWINFYKRHIKLIGASQHGKSSMAAALLEAIMRTHDPDKVQVALLDLEDRTSRLFANSPHITKVRKHGETINLHARSYEEVLEHLGYINALIDYRYRLSLEELARQPLLIVYLEEFLDLKNHYKALIDTSDRARDEYIKLVYIIKKIAARGLKVLVQLIMCSQVNYRDDDLQEALVNVTAGMSFCVLPSAAQAAGFYQSELLAKTAKDDKVGVAVAQFSDCNDIILAPDYDLEARLKALQGNMQSPAQQTVIDVSVNDRVDMPDSDLEVASSDLARALRAYDEGHTTVNALALALDMSPWTVRPIYTQVRQMRGRVSVG